MLNFIQRPLLADENRRDKVERIADAVAETVKGLFLAGTMLFWGYVLIVALPDLVLALEQYLLAKAQEGTTFAGTLYNVRRPRLARNPDLSDGLGLALGCPSTPSHE